MASTVGIPTRVAMIVVIVAALVAAAGVLGPVAVAEDKALLGGGAGIALNGGLCTLATIGHDGSGEMVGFTSAHCGGPGVPVAAEGGPVVGSVVAASNDLDYAVIRFDAAKVTPVADFDGFAINGIGPDPGITQGECHQSRATGHVCANIAGPARDPDTLTATECGNPDDSGAPVTVNDLLVGMIRGGFTPSGQPCYIQPFPDVVPIFRKADRPKIVLINAIIDDLNAKGGPGAGFTPVPA
jgi:hypothetical protein